MNLSDANDDCASVIPVIGRYEVRNISDLKK